MVETFSPAVCGTADESIAQALFAARRDRRRRRRVGLLLAPPRLARARAAAVALAVAGVLREAGLVRFPLPQSRRQVPERWHHELPLPSGRRVRRRARRGLLHLPAGLDFLVVAVAAAASGTTAAVLALTAFGVGRVAGAALPAGFVDRMAMLYRPMRRVNALALAALALALVAAPAGAATLALGPAASSTRPSPPTARSPTRSAPTTAPRRSSCRPAGGRPVTVPGASEPSMRGEYLAYRDPAGVAVVRWRRARRSPSHRRLVEAGDQLAVPRRRARARHAQACHRHRLRTGRRTFLDVISNGDDLGRPSIDRSLVVWHKTTRTSSRLLIGDVRTGRASTLRASRRCSCRTPRSVATW